MTTDDFEYDHRFDPPTDEVLRRLELSKQEAAGLVLRDIKCPVCGFRILRAFTTEGCVMAKCQRCKFNGPISFRWFRRQKPSFFSRRYDDLKQLNNFKRL